MFSISVQVISSEIVLLKTLTIMRDLYGFFELDVGVALVEVEKDVSGDMK